MTLEEAKQKILARVLATTEGWSVTMRDLTGTSMFTYMRNPALKVVVERGETKHGLTVNVKTDGDNPITLLHSNKHPELIEWWDRAEKASTEKRVIDFALSLS
jgi:hypothetical protein